MIYFQYNIVDLIIKSLAKHKPEIYSKSPHKSVYIKFPNKKLGIIRISDHLLQLRKNTFIPKYSIITKIPKFENNKKLRKKNFGSKELDRFFTKFNNNLK